MVDLAKTPVFCGENEPLSGRKAHPAAGKCVFASPPGGLEFTSSLSYSRSPATFPSRTMRTILLLLLLISPSAVASAAEAISPAVAIASFQQGKFDKLQKQAEQVGRDDPHFAAAAVIVALCHLQNQDPRKAVERLEQAIAADKDQTLQTYGKISAIIYPPLGPWDESYRGDAESLLDGVPEEIVAKLRTQIAEKPLDLSHYRRRIEVAEEVYYDEDQPGQYAEALVRIDWGLCDLTITLVDAEQTAATLRQRAEFWSERHDVTYLNDDETWAVDAEAADIKRALDLTQWDVDGLDDYFWALYLGDRSQEIQDELKRRETIGDAQWRREWGVRSNMQLLRYADAIFDLTAMIRELELDPQANRVKLILSLDDRARCRLNLKVYSGAIRDARKAITLNEAKSPDYFRYRLIYEAMLRMGDQAAVDAIIEHPKEGVDFPDLARRERAAYALEQGKLDDALQDYLVMLEKTDGPYDHEVVADIYRRQGKTELADQHAKRAAELQAALPDSP